MAGCQNVLVAVGVSNVVDTKKSHTLLLVATSKQPANPIISNCFFLLLFCFFFCIQISTSFNLSEVELPKGFFNTFLTTSYSTLDGVEVKNTIALFLNCAHIQLLCDTLSTIGMWHLRCFISLFCSSYNIYVGL